MLHSIAQVVHHVYESTTWVYDMSTIMSRIFSKLYITRITSWQHHIQRVDIFVATNMTDWPWWLMFDLTSPPAFSWWAGNHPYAFSVITYESCYSYRYSTWETFGNINLTSPEAIVVNPLRVRPFLAKFVQGDSAPLELSAPVKARITKLDGKAGPMVNSLWCNFYYASSIFSRSNEVKCHEFSKSRCWTTYRLS